jgi:ectoine hydroxylase-related dioxygenase (phytanoyl-CoA dioxygenase family)
MDNATAAIRTNAPAGTSGQTDAPIDSFHRMQEFGGSLSVDQRRQYDADGYLVLERLLNAEDLRPAEQAMTRKVNLIADDLVRDGLVPDRLEHRPFQYRLAELFAHLDDKAFLKYGRSWRDRFEGYFTLMTNPKVLDAVESLIGPEIFCNPVYNVRPKVPRVAAGAVPWHQDKSYWPDANSNPVITVWIPLVDSTHENGCLQLIPGTHRRKVINFHFEAHTGTGYTETDLEAVEREAKKRRIVSIPVPAGTAILFNDRLLHSSTPNNSSHVRWSVDLRYQPTGQDPMTQHGAGFLARSRMAPERAALLEDWLAHRTEHDLSQP